jgi:hypothetical protein
LQGLVVRLKCLKEYLLYLEQAYLIYQLNFFSYSLKDSISGGVDELLPLKELVLETPYSQEYLSLRARQGFLDAVKIVKRGIVQNVQLKNIWTSKIDRASRE